MKHVDAGRIDQWLWAVRVFKTRSQAADACRGGRVRVNGEPVKASRNVHVGETITARAGEILRPDRVLALLEKRLSAASVGDYAEDLAASMLASTLGVEFDPDAAWNERKRVYETTNLIIGSTSTTAYAEGDAGGRWTCAVAAAVFRFT